MTTYYSQSTNGFYDSAIYTSESEKLPSDAVEISQDTYLTLMASQSAGQKIQGDANGNPVAVNPPAPTPAQQAVSALNGAITLTSTGIPALNGVYPIGADVQSQINNLVTYIIVNNAFPAGLASWPWPDAPGTMHMFPTVASFKNFATAVANYVAVLNLYANSNGAIGTLLSSNITIP